MPNNLVHFEILGDDPETMADFYRGLLGSKIEKTPMDYWLIETSPDGQGIGDGMMKRQAPEQGPVNNIGVESVDEHLKKAGRLGATVIVPKMAVAGVGYIAVVLDSQGNPLGLYKGDTSAQ